MSITALPTPPSRSDDPANFSNKADAFLAAMPTFVTQANALESNVNAKEASATASASSASASATAASGSAGSAATQAGNAAASAAAADAAKTAAEAALDNFDDRYLGAKTADPTLDNDGNALLAGALYWNSTNGAFKVWNGSAWGALGTGGTLGTLAAQNASDVSVGNLTVSAALTHSAGTANGVVYLNGSKRQTSGSGLQFDGVNLGIGVAPSGWVANHKALEGTSLSLVDRADTSGFHLTCNAKRISGTDWTYKTSSAASMYQQSGGVSYWYVAGSGTAGNAITWVNQMVLDASSNLLVQAASVTSGVSGFQVKDAIGTSIPNGQSFSAATASCLYVGSMSTGRSISGRGTFNASGADYAEYEEKAEAWLIHKFSKGDVVGFNKKGKLTPKWSEAVRFGIKSTSPSYVGGDAWGGDDVVGVRPDHPSPPASAFPAAPQIVDTNAPTSEELSALAVWRDNLEQIAAAADQSYRIAMIDYQAELALFEQRLEAARSKVDRVAYSGKVPVNVVGAQPGGYVVAEEGTDGMIVGRFVSDPDFSQYKRVVGRVNRVLEDGRAEVAVVVH